MPMKIKISPHIITLMQLLESANEEVYLVGGFVRDTLLKKPCHDYDLATSALPETMVTLFQSHGYTLILTGMRHGTIIVSTLEGMVEITTYRQEFNYISHRSPQTVQFTNSIYEDLKRRDFTINAMAYHPTRGIIDPFNGQQDLQRHILRAVGNPYVRLQEDALRILRAIRLQCCLDLEIEAQTKQAIIKHISLLSYLSKERIQQELHHIMMSHKAPIMHILSSYQTIPYLFPPFQKMLVDKNSIHAIDTLRTKSLTSSFPIRFATILYPIFITYGICEITQYLQKMKYSKKFIKHIETLLQYASYPIYPTTASLRKLLFLQHNTFSIVSDIIHFQYILHGDQQTKLLLKILHTIEKTNDIFTPSQLAVNGHDILQLGYQGKQIQIILHALYELVLSDISLNTKDTLLTYIKQHSPI